MNNTKRFLRSLAACACIAGASLAAQAQQFSNVIFFGDSLTDAGYFKPVLAAAGAPASLGLGRFTTVPGPVWAELVAAYYGHPTLPSNQTGGLDFAQGGARVATNSASTPTGAAQRPITTQVGEYLTRAGGGADPNALYLMWAGANDVLQTLPLVSTGAITSDQAAAAIQAAAGAEIQQIGRLQAAGARYIAVVTLPNIGATPALIAAGAAASAGATQLSAGFNTALLVGLAQNNIHVVPIDAFTFLTEIRGNPSAYGFTNITTPACGPFPPFSTGPDALFCPPNVWATPNANQTYLFADGIHPTTAAHAIIAQFVESMISAPNQYSLLAEAPLSSMRGHQRTLSDALTLGRNRVEDQRWHVFVSADYGKFKIDRDVGVQEFKNETRTVTLGATTSLSDAVTLGIAGGWNNGGNEFAASTGNFNTKEKILSLFGSLTLGGFYGTGIVSLSDVSYGEIRRYIPLGPATRVENANATGTNAAAQFFAGYDFRMGRFSIGPTVGVTTQHVSVSQFDEQGNDSTALRIFEQTRRSEVWSGGLRAAFQLGGGWMPWLRVTYDKERRDDPRVVTAMPLTLVATGNNYSIPAYMPDNTYTTLLAGIRGTLADGRMGLGLQYYTVMGRSGIHDDGVSVLVSYRF